MTNLHQSVWRSMLILCLLPICFISCSEQTGEQKTALPAKGLWRATLDLGKEILPFNFELEGDSTNFTMFLVNASERLQIDEISIEKDSLFIRMPVFDTEFRARILSSTKLEGIWYNHSRGDDYSIPFEAEHGVSSRFDNNKDIKPSRIDGRWKTTFAEDDASIYMAVGIFEQEADQVVGTFLTETGDYRFLQGNVIGDTLKLSAFDGDHAYVFVAQLQPDGSLRGEFFSGIHSYITWTAQRDDLFNLRDPNSLTFLKEGYESISFTFPDLENREVSLNDSVFQDKVVLIQLMGSWCPNCMDESILYADLYKRYKDQGLEIIALAYERATDPQRAVANVKRLKERLAVDYHFLIAGTSDKTEASKTLPMLNGIISFPTSIYIDKQGRVRKIHTGFYGPGTGVYYTRFVEDTQRFLEKLLSEEV